MDLHPCRCGELDFEPDHTVEQRADHLITRYEGRCPGCGVSRTFEFVLDPELPPAPPAYGGDRPSSIIDPGQFLHVGRQLASAMPADPEELRTGEDFEDARELLAMAIAAVAEVLKFVPAGADRVPEEAFTAPDGWMIYHQDPGQFTRNRLQATLHAYQQVLETYDRAAPVPPSS